MISVTDDMILAAIDRLNEIKAADAPHETIVMPWGDVCREIYTAMETRRRETLLRKQPLIRGHI